MRDAIRQILVNDWDPHSVIDRPEAHAAYDVYIEPLVRLIDSHADEETVVQFLHERESETMCFPSLGTRRLKAIARKLIKLGATVK